MIWQVDVCWQCGDIGLSEALVFCIECKSSARHRYIVIVANTIYSSETSLLTLMNILFVLSIQILPRRST